MVTESHPSTEMVISKIILASAIIIFAFQALSTGTFLANKSTGDKEMAFVAGLLLGVIFNAIEYGTVLMFKARIPKFHTSKGLPLREWLGVNLPITITFVAIAVVVYVDGYSTSSGMQTIFGFPNELCIVAGFVQIPMFEYLLNLYFWLRHSANSKRGVLQVQVDEA